MNTPDIDINFVELARNFSESFRSYYNPCTFSSNDGEWEIAYVNNEHYNKTKGSVTFARVSNNKKRIEISKSMSQHEAITNHFMFYYLIWLYIHWNDKDRDLMKADTLAIQYYINQDRPTKDIVSGMANTILSGHSINAPRFEAIAEKIGFKDKRQQAIDNLKKVDEESLKDIKVMPDDMDIPDNLLKGHPVTKEELEYAMRNDNSKDAEFIDIMEAEGEDLLMQHQKLVNGEFASIDNVEVEPYCPSHFYFMDTEFHEYKKKRGFRPPTDTIELISIGIVSGDQREYYAVCKDFDLKAAWNNDWLRENVLKKIHKELCAEVSMYGKTYHSNLFASFTIKSMKNLIKWHGKSQAQIREDILKFTLDPTEEFLHWWNGGTVEYLHALKDNEIKGDKPQFFTYFGSYDWVVFCWIFGRMIDLPKSFPMYTLDLKQFMWEAGLNQEWKKEVVPEPEDAHNALADARWNRELFIAINEITEPMKIK